ncbi:hypothetical protein Tco_0745385 [Tanacetum coccineum]
MIPGANLHQFDVHNDGYFSHLSVNCVDGVILEMAIRMMPYEEFVVYLEEKCGCYFQGLYYQVPSQDLEKGLVRVNDDRSLSYMFDVEETFGRLNLYLDHLDMDLSEYLSQAITYDMNAYVYKKIGPLKKRRATVKIDSKTEYESDDDRNYQLDKSVDYLSPGEEELIELRNKMKANREAKAKTKDNPVSEMNKPNNNVLIFGKRYWGRRSPMDLSDGVPVSVPTAVPQGLTVLLTDAAMQTDVPEEESSPKLTRSKLMPSM